MKALATRQPWAEMIATGEKKAEYRTWHTRYRGPLVIIASSQIHADGPSYHDHCERLPRSCLVALVDLVAIEGDDGSYSWILKNPRRLEPVRFTRSRVMTFDIDDALVKLAKGEPCAPYDVPGAHNDPQPAPAPSAPRAPRARRFDACSLIPRPWITKRCR